MALQDFIVLGIIPGTNIQLNFLHWLLAVLLVFIAWETRRFLHSDILVAVLLRRALRNAVIEKPIHVSDVAL